jgi:hypothetical protein
VCARETWRTERRGGSVRSTAAAFHSVAAVATKGGGLAQAWPRRKRGGPVDGVAWARGDRHRLGAAEPNRRQWCHSVMRGGRGGHGDGEVGSST